MLYFEIIYIERWNRYTVLAQESQNYFERLERKSSRMSEVSRSILTDILI